MPFFLGLKVPVGGRRKDVGQVGGHGADSRLLVDSLFCKGKTVQVFTVEIAGYHTTVAVAS